MNKQYKEIKRSDIFFNLLCVVCKNLSKKIRIKIELKSGYVTHFGIGCKSRAPSLGCQARVQYLKQAEAKGCPGDWRVYNRYKVFESVA